MCANLNQPEHWIFPLDWPHVKNPSHSKSCHVQCSCHPIQVQRTSQTINMFPRIGWSPRIPSHYLLKFLYQTEFVDRYRCIFVSPKPTFELFRIQLEFASLVNIPWIGESQPVQLPCWNVVVKNIASLLP